MPADTPPHPSSGSFSRRFARSLHESRLRPGGRGGACHCNSPLPLNSMQSESRLQVNRKGQGLFIAGNRTGNINFVQKNTNEASAERGWRAEQILLRRSQCLALLLVSLGKHGLVMTDGN